MFYVSDLYIKAKGKCTYVIPMRIGFEVLTAVVLQSSVIRDIAPQGRTLQIRTGLGAADNTAYVHLGLLINKTALLRRELLHSFKHAYCIFDEIYKMLAKTWYLHTLN
jgi:hypothetical protein